MSHIALYFVESPRRCRSVRGRTRPHVPPKQLSQHQSSHVSPQSLHCLSGTGGGGGGGGVESVVQCCLHQSVGSPWFIAHEWHILPGVISSVGAGALIYEDVVLVAKSVTSSNQESRSSSSGFSG